MAFYVVKSRASPEQFQRGFAVFSASRFFPLCEQHENRAEATSRRGIPQSMNRSYTGTILTFQHLCVKVLLLKLQHLQKWRIVMQERFETFTVLINRISRDIRKIKNQEMADYHLRSVHVSCLYYIYSLGSVTSAELCEHCEEDKATISRAVDYLETNGFLLRDTGAKRYKSPLRLTDKGRDAGKRIADKIGGILETISHALTENERIEFYRCLSTISRSLEAIVQNSEEKEM
jgi:DNA-binding MarR family transcriptional regulator